jgi:PAS domain S-box-containing protein
MENQTGKNQCVLSYEQLRAFVDNVPAVLYLATPLEQGAARLIYMSKQIESLAGYSSEQLLADGDLWADLIHPDDRDGALAAYAQCYRKAEGFELQYRIMHREGTVRYVHDMAEPVLTNCGKVERIAGLITDVSGRRRAEQELSRTQMLQSIGRLSAGIAHEINTPVQFIGDNIQFLSDAFAKLNRLLRIYERFCLAAQNSEVPLELVQQAVRAEREADLEFLKREIPEAIGQSLEGIKRVTTIVAAMRDFSRLDERRKVTADLNKALQSTLVILRNELKYIADVETDLDPDLPKIMCYLDDLHQVFLNLMTNAIHSIREVVASGKTERGLIRVSTCLDGDEAVIEIADTGTGIAPENQKKVFDAFFTTKQPGKGTGQGLSIARSIVVDKHGGSISFDTEAGVGTTFTIRLPIMREGRIADGKEEKGFVCR